MLLQYFIQIVHYRCNLYCFVIVDPRIQLFSFLLSHFIDLLFPNFLSKFISFFLKHQIFLLINIFYYKNAKLQTYYKHQFDQLFSIQNYIFTVYSYKFGIFGINNLVSSKYKMQSEKTYRDLTNQQLRTMYNSHGILLLLDVPEGIQFGIDNIVWIIGTKFKGIKFIPLGVHIISYSLKDENNMFKINKFIHFDRNNQYLVYRWNTQYQLFMEVKGQDYEGYKEGIKQFHFDSYLGPYPQSNITFWKQNTNYITKQVLHKLDPVDKMLKFQEQYEKVKIKEKQQVFNIDQEQQNINDLEEKQIIEDQQQEEKQAKQKNSNRKNKGSKKFENVADTIFYSQIPRKLTDQPSHTNQININKTQVLKQVIIRQYNGKYQGILGELQYSFIYFLIGQDQDSFEQWKKLINLIVFSEQIYQRGQLNLLKMDLQSKQQIRNKMEQQIQNNFQKLALQFIVVIYNQLKQFPIDFFIDQLSKNNFIQSCLKRIKSYAKEVQTVAPKVRKRIQKLLKLLQSHFNYQIQSQDQDQLIIVEENQSYF